MKRIYQFQNSFIQTCKIVNELLGVFVLGRSLVTLHYRQNHQGVRPDKSIYTQVTA